ncbi:MAG: hypothetical protein IT258_13885 [Saprospiraceae bacterium]|nr:hypothetical protein [Saprospiraceae bacterium]
MKRFNWFFFLATFSISFLACGGSNEHTEKEDALKDEVFAIHDEVMPKMSDIVALKGKLLDMAADSTKALEAKAAISQLEKAEEGMMDWMNNFQQPDKLRETKQHEEIMAYLESEKQRIAAVREAMNNSIKTGQRILAEAPKAE